MTARAGRTATPIGLGLRATRGGGVVVAVAMEGGQPRVTLSAFLPTGAEGDRLSQEPYHVASEMARASGGGASAEAVAAVEEGRARQRRLAAEGLDAIVRKLRNEACEPVIAALLANRAGWVTDLLAYSLAYPEHARVAEGLAVRDALRAALSDAGISLVDVDEKSLAETASEALGLSAADIERRLKTLGAAAGKPWRKEQKLACLGAWMALARPGTA